MSLKWAIVFDIIRMKSHVGMPKWTGHIFFLKGNDTTPSSRDGMSRSRAESRCFAGSALAAVILAQSDCIVTPLPWRPSREKPRGRDYAELSVVTKLRCMAVVHHRTGRSTVKRTRGNLKILYSNCGHVHLNPSRSYFVASEDSDGRSHCISMVKSRPLLFDNAYRASP